MAINIFNLCGDYKELSMSFTCSVEIDGKVWPSVSRYITAQLADPNESERIRTADPGKLLAVDASRSIQDLEAVIRKALLAKFRNSRLSKKLLATGTHKLIDGSPKPLLPNNRVGELMMEIRSEIYQRSKPRKINVIHIKPKQHN